MVVEGSHEGRNSRDLTSQNHKQKAEDTLGMALLF